MVSSPHSIANLCCLLHTCAEDVICNHPLVFLGHNLLLGLLCCLSWLGGKKKIVFGAGIFFLTGILPVSNGPPPCCGLCKIIWLWSAVCAFLNLNTRNILLESQGLARVNKIPIITQTMSVKFYMTQWPCGGVEDWGGMH